MQELSSALNRLLPLVADSKSFDNTENDQPILDAATRLKKLSHQVKNLPKPSADPAYDSIATMLDEDLGRAIAALKSGNRDYARLTIRESIGYCIQCHTQSSFGPSFPKLDLGFDASKLSPLGQGDYYAATRQFDSALNAYRKGVEDTNYAKADIFGWERAVRSGLAISVRFKEDPKAALAIAEAVRKNSAAPASLKTSALGWKKSITEWQKEQSKPKSAKSKSASKPTELTADEHLSRAERLMKAASDAGPRERGLEVLYMRASADLHFWLSKNANAPAQKRALALALAGEAAAATRELNFWVLHERYFEMCIEQAPKTEIAKRCYKNLSDSVLLGYTGSSGLNLPSEESIRLARFKEMAFP